ncbi:MAG: EAL domain-containing protein [Gammaproteobacteria bacterium]|nr:EAL domain-containing protein [Gammaproteobacteria bacterium]
MSKEQQTLRLIIIEETQNDAEAIANILRGAGYAVRFMYAEDREDLEQALDQQLPDLILCAQELETFDLEQIVALLRARSLNIPLIAIGASADEAKVVEALRAGATDLVSFDAPEHLRLVIVREQRNLEMQRALNFYRAGHKESERRCRALLDSSRDSIAYVHDGMHIYANRSYLDMFGFENLDEIEGTPIMDMVAGEDQGSFKEFLRTYGKDANVDADGDASLDVKCVSAKGAFKAKMEFSSATIDGEPCTQIVIRDQAIGDKELEQKLKYLSKQDVLTGLYNRQYFMEELELAVNDARAGSGNSGLLYVLLDNFKSVKESVGLGASDLVVSDIAQLIKDKVGALGLPARFGDSSFTVLLKGKDATLTQTFAEHLRHAVEEHILDIEGRSLTITVSIGISLITDSSPDAQEILSRADLACEVARSSGGNRVHLHNPVADEQVGREREQQWNHLIHEALAEDRFHLVYQPIVSLQGETDEKYEVLLRMRDSEGEDIRPGQFLPVALQTGQIAEIDRWVLRKAIGVLAERRRGGASTVFFIKLSGPTLDDHELPIWINQQLKEARLASDAIVLEIAEADASQYLKSAKAFVSAVGGLHCKTSLEHFGSSPNSFQLLKHLPVDYLKIDGKFIHNLMRDSDNQAVVKSIVDVARSMNKLCIAEFVEDASSLTVLFQYGIHYIQGYFLAEPTEGLNYDFTEGTI